MAELTAEIVRTIIKEEITELRVEMNQRFEIARQATAAGIEQVLATVQRLSDEERDETVGLAGRLRSP
jgi:hypothetical protein